MSWEAGSAGSPAFARDLDVVGDGRRRLAVVMRGSPAAGMLSGFGFALRGVRTAGVHDDRSSG